MTGGGQRRATLWMFAALLVGLVLGVGIGVLLRTPTMPDENSAEAGFARDMSTHHAQAVEMGMIAYAKAANSDVRFMGRDIALTQQGQVGIMQGWLEQWHLDPTGSRPPMAWMADGKESLRNGLMPGMATPEQIAQLRAATGRDVDVQFLNLMIQHHLGGIHMAEEVAKLSDNEQVDKLAQIAMNGQQRELTDMRNLLADVQKTE